MLMTKLRSANMITVWYWKGCHRYTSSASPKSTLRADHASTASSLGVLLKSIGLKGNSSCPNRAISVLLYHLTNSLVKSHQSRSTPI